MIKLLSLITKIGDQFESKTSDNTAQITGTKKQGSIALDSMQWLTLVH